jgi:hypothetical protein
MFHLREVQPKDFYFAQLLRQQEGSMLELVERVILNKEVLDIAQVPQVKAMADWASKNIMEGNILTVENWLETGYHLCKQRWDQSMDWLETQPMSKIQTMIDIVKNHAEEVEKAQKKAARG